MTTATLLPTYRVQEKLLTAADLAALPHSLPSGDVRYELNDGRLVIMAPPGDGHSRRQAMIVYYLITQGELRGHGEVRDEVGIVLRHNPDRVVGADAAFILNRSLPVRRSAEGYLETIPELVVEVRSKNDSLAEVVAKNNEYFNAGVEMVWVIDQDKRTVTAHRRGVPDLTVPVTDVLTCHLIPGFAVPVANLFAGS